MQRHRPRRRCQRHAHRSLHPARPASGYGGHPFLGAILDEIVKRTATFEAEWCNDQDVLHATGPDVVTTVYYRHRERWTDVEVLKGDPTLTGPQPPVGPGYPKEWQRLGSYGTHLLNGGWLHGK